MEYEGKITKTFKPLGHTEVVYVSDRYNGEYLDTNVLIGGQSIIWIEGNKIQEFHDKLTELINNYRI
jgi:hypothetical protein